MRRSFRYLPEQRAIRIVVPKSYQFPRELLRRLNQEDLILKPSIDLGKPRNRKKSITITLAGQDGLPSNNLLERLAYWLSRVPGHRVVHDPWERGGRPVNITLAVELVVDTILDFDEKKLEALPA